MELTPNKGQYIKLTLEKKILPPGFELKTFQSLVWRFNQQAIPPPNLVLQLPLHLLLLCQIFGHRLVSPDTHKPLGQPCLAV